MTHRLALVALLSLASGQLASAGQEPTAAPMALLRAGPDGYYVALVLDPPARPDTPASSISASVYRGGKLLTQTVRGGDEHGAPFTMLLGDAATFGDWRGMLVAVSSYPTATTTGAFAVPVAIEVQTSVSTNSPQCDFAIQNASNLNREPTPYEAARLRLLHDYIRKHPPTAQTEMRTRKGVENRTLTFDDAFELENVILDCFTLGPRLAPGSYDLKLTFPADAPVELRPALLKTGITVSAHKNAPLAVDAGQVGKRPLEENLDLGLQFGSSVSRDAAGNATRSSKGSVDLRFAPLLNLLPVPDDGSTSLWFFTPVFLDARISSGDITRETIAQNRIVIGSDVELRHYTSPTTFPTYQRFIMSFRNAADRDFKQAEWKFGGEVHLVYSMLNRPLAWKEDTEASQLDPTRDPKRIVPVLGVGWQFVPILGVEFGHTWRSEQPAAAIEKTSKVYRAYFGGTASLDLTRFMTVSFKDVLYLRGETDTDQARNYLLAKVEIPLAGFSATTAQSVFFSYERGGQPPFSTPDVDALKLGYRLLWNGWAQQFR